MVIIVRQHWVDTVTTHPVKIHAGSVCPAPSDQRVVCLMAIIILSAIGEALGLDRRSHGREGNEARG